MIVALAVAVAALPACRPPLLARAVQAAGGQSRLARVRRIEWRGTARIFAADRIIAIGVHTQLAPFGAVRSDSWLLRDGPGKMRSLIFYADGHAEIERDGERRPMPTAMAANERGQYALYGLMLLAPLCGADVVAAGPDQLLSRDGRAPETLLEFSGARLTGMRNRVRSDSGDRTIAQRFTLEGQAQHARIRWPRVLRIEQDGKPWFELTIDRLDVTFAPA